jgi:hypothetical protein
MSLDTDACASAECAEKRIVQVLGDAMSAVTQDIRAEREVANTTVFLAPVPYVRQRAQWTTELWYGQRFYRRLDAKIRTQRRTCPV